MDPLRDSWARGCLSEFHLPKHPVRDEAQIANQSMLNYPGGAPRFSLVSW